MTERITTHITYAAGVITAFGPWFEPVFSDTSATMSNNIKQVRRRDGLEIEFLDSKKLFPIRGLLNITGSMLDTKSGIQYLANYHYLGNTLHWSFRNKIPIVIQRTNLNGTALKSYLCRILSEDPDVAGQTVEDTTELLHLSRFTRKQTVQYQLSILQNSDTINFADPTAIVWESRA